MKLCKVCKEREPKPGNWICDKCSSERTPLQVIGECCKSISKEQGYGIERQVEKIFGLK